MECDGLFLSFTDELLEENKKFIIDLESDNALIPLSKIDLDNPLFNMIIVTEEVSRYLAQIKKLINSSATKNYTNISNLLHDILKVLTESGMLGTSVVHTETLLYQLLRDPERLYDRPDFSKKDIGYCIIPLAQSIMKKDLHSALAFEKFKMEMKDLDTYMKNKNGVFDLIFKVEKPPYLKKISPTIISEVLSEDL